MLLSVLPTSSALTVFMLLPVSVYAALSSARIQDCTAVLCIFSYLTQNAVLTPPVLLEAVTFELFPGDPRSEESPSTTTLAFFASALWALLLI